MYVTYYVIYYDNWCTLINILLLTFIEKNYFRINKAIIHDSHLKDVSLPKITNHLARLIPSTDESFQRYRWLIATSGHESSLPPSTTHLSPDQSSVDTPEQGVNPVGFGEHRSEGQRESTTPQQHPGLHDGCVICVVICI